MSGDVPILAYLRGDDGWSLDRAVAAIATQLGDATGAPPERWRVTGAETSAAVINERVATAPMFGGGTVAAIVDPGPLVRSRESRDGLEHAIRNVAPGNALVFIEQGDSGGRRSAALQRLETTVRAAGGDVKAFKAPRGGELTAWVRDRAAERGMSLEPAAAKELASRIGGFVKEGDVDRQRQSALAVAELDKLALYRGNDAVTEADVRALVSEVVPDSTWAFLDAVADRRSSAAGPLLDHLLEFDPGAGGDRAAAPAAARAARGGGPPGRRRLAGEPRPHAQAEPVPCGNPGAAGATMDAAGAGDGPRGRAGPRCDGQAGAGVRCERSAATPGVRALGAGAGRGGGGSAFARPLTREGGRQSAEDQASSWRTTSLSMANTHRPSPRSSISISSGSMYSW